MTNHTGHAIEENDHYILPLAGRTVSRCYVDFAFGLCFYSEGPTTEIRIEGGMRLLGDKRKVEINVAPGMGPDPVSLGPVLILFNRRVVWAHAFKNGSLKMLFDSDLTFEVDPGEKYEPWELSSADGLKLVSLPGGSLAYWKPREM